MLYLSKLSLKPCKGLSKNYFRVRPELNHRRQTQNSLTAQSSLISWLGKLGSKYDEGKASSTNKKKQIIFDSVHQKIQTLALNVQNLKS